MKFSIIIPVYKTERFLPRCLDSLVAQTDGDFETIVVDDASPGEARGRDAPVASARGRDAPVASARGRDAPVASEDTGHFTFDAARAPRPQSEGAPRPQSEGAPRPQSEGAPRPQAVAEIVLKYGSRFRSVRHEKNRSAFQARWTGIKAATGDYVVPVDPDDYLVPETLAKLREAIDRANPDLVSYRMEYDDGRKIWPHWCRHPDTTVSGADALRELTEHTYFTGVASKAFRREKLLSALDELSAPDNLYVNTSDDFLMLVPMLMKCDRVSFLDFAGYRYFINGESASFSWKTTDGFRRACEQTHAADELVLRMARRDGVAAETRLLVEKAVSGIERWFVQMAVEGSVGQWEAFSTVLLETLSPENVAAELMAQLTGLRRSRSYRVVKALSRILRRAAI